MRYHSLYVAALTSRCEGQCLLGSLPGAGASKNVTEAYKGMLGTDGNRT